MDILSAMNHAKRHPQKVAFWRESWLGANGHRTADGETDYTIPSYIFYDGYEERFVAVFWPGNWEDSYDGPILEEDYLNGVVIANWSTADVLATDWRISDDSSIFKSKRRTYKNAQGEKQRERTN